MGSPAATPVLLSQIWRVELTRVPLPVEPHDNIRCPSGMIIAPANPVWDRFSGISLSITVFQRRPPRTTSHEKTRLPSGVTIALASRDHGPVAVPTREPVVRSQRSSLSSSDHDKR